MPLSQSQSSHSETQRQQELPTRIFCWQEDMVTREVSVFQDPHSGEITAEMRRRPSYAERSGSLVRDDLFGAASSSMPASSLTHRNRAIPVRRGIRRHTPVRQQQVIEHFQQVAHCRDPLSHGHSSTSESWSIECGKCAGDIYVDNSHCESISRSRLRL